MKKTKFSTRLSHFHQNSDQRFTVLVKPESAYAELEFFEADRTTVLIILPLEQLEALTEMLTIAKNNISGTDKGEVDG